MRISDWSSDVCSSDLFPLSRAAAMETLMQTDRWEGVLVHARRDGPPATVASRWSLERNERGQPISILEINTDITDHVRAPEAPNRPQAELPHDQHVTTMGRSAARRVGKECVRTYSLR